VDDRLQVAAREFPRILKLNTEMTWSDLMKLSARKNYQPTKPPEVTVWRIG